MQNIQDSTGNLRDWMLSLCTHQRTSLLFTVILCSSLHTWLNIRETIMLNLNGT